MQVILLLVEAVDLDDVRVSAKNMKDFRFFLEALAVSWISEKALVDGFTGEGVAGDGGVTAVDDPEATSADLPAELIIVVESFGHVRLD